MEARFDFRIIVLLRQQELPQHGAADLMAVVGYHLFQNRLPAHQDHHPLGAGHGGVEQVPGEEHGGTVVEGNDHAGVFAALALVDRHGPGVVQLVQLGEIQ